MSAKKIPEHFKFEPKGTVDQVKVDENDMKFCRLHRFGLIFRPFRAVHLLN